MYSTLNVHWTFLALRSDGNWKEKFFHDTLSALDILALCNAGDWKKSSSMVLSVQWTFLALQNDSNWKKKSVLETHGEVESPVIFLSLYSMTPLPP